MRSAYKPGVGITSGRGNGATKARAISPDIGDKIEATSATVAASTMAAVDPTMIARVKGAARPKPTIAARASEKRRCE